MTEDSPISPLVGQWTKKLEVAWKHKKEQFQDDADEAMRFFDGPYDFLYTVAHSARQGGGVRFLGGERNLPVPTFAMTVNKVAELVQLFGPVLYHRNPIRRVTPRQVWEPDPALLGNPMTDPLAAQTMMMLSQQTLMARTVDATRASLLEQYLNYTPAALDLKSHSRLAIVEALIKGMGTLWTELHQPPGSPLRFAGTFYDTADNLLIDPDAECLWDAQWIARRCVHPVWEVERTYGLEPGAIKGQLESADQMALVESSGPMGDELRRQGKTNDLCVYWKIYSKMGLGGRLPGAPEELKQPLEFFGDFCYLVITKGSPYPLNLPPALFAQGPTEGLFERAQWPTPFWLDGHWPLTPIVFHPRPRKVWPMSHLKPAMGEIQFINWVYSFITSKIAKTSKDYIVLPKSLGEEIKQTILSGDDLELIEMEEVHGKTIAEVVSYLKGPEFNGDIWKVLEKVEDNFEKRVGLTELMYAQTPFQMRSAEEARVKSGQLQVRPDDMANKVEDSMSELADKEAFAAYWHLTSQDVQPALGAVGAHYWQQVVTASPVPDVLFNLQYRVEAGSTRKPNQDRDAANMQSAMQTLFQNLWGYAQMTGDVNPVNALIVDWAKSIELDASRYLLRPPPPPVLPPAPTAGPAGGAEANGQPPARQGVMP